MILLRQQAAITYDQKLVHLENQCFQKEKLIESLVT
jgi:hypothetical protein